MKCLREEIQGNVLVSGEYLVSEVPGQKIDFVVIYFLFCVLISICRLGFFQTNLQYAQFRFQSYCSFVFLVFCLFF